MTGGWVRYENTTPDNLKVAQVSDRAFRLWFNAGCYCSRARSNGVVPAALLARLSKTANRRVIEELLSAGLLERLDETAFAVHDYLDYNPSRERIDELKEANLKRVSQWRERQHTPPQRNGVVTHYSHARDRTERVKTASESSSGLGESKPARARSRRANQDEFPTSLPSELHAVARSALNELHAVHVERGGYRPTLRGVGLAIARFPDRDHLDVVGKLQHWALAGAGQAKPVKDWAGTFATFLGREPAGLPSRPAAGNGGVRRPEALDRQDDWRNAVEYRRGAA